MSEKIIKIELHTIATYNGKEYELEELMNNMFELNGKLHEQLQQKENIIKEVREKIEGVRIYGLRSGKTLISSLLNDILEILDNEVN